MKKSTNLADAGETKNVACSQIEMSDAHALHILSLKGAVAGKEFAALRAEVERLAAEYQRRFAEVCAKHGLSPETTTINFETGAVT